MKPHGLNTIGPSAWLARDQAMRLAAHYRAPARRAEAAVDVLAAVLLAVVAAAVLVHWFFGAAA